MPFLDENGLSRLWTNIIARLNEKADKSELPSLDGLATEEYVDTVIRNVTSGSGITLQRLSQEEYDLIDKDPNTLYIIV